MVYNPAYEKILQLKTTKLCLRKLKIQFVLIFLPAGLCFCWNNLKIYFFKIKTLEQTYIICACAISRMYLVVAPY